MNKREFKDWCTRTGYSTINDWNHQTIDSCHYYFIKNYETNLYALVKENPITCDYKILIAGWTDYNGWEKL